MDDYVCNNKECNFTDEYNNNIPALRVPEVCPQCKIGIMEKKFNLQGVGGFDIVGYCYANTYGKKNWKKHLSQAEQARVLTGDREAY